MVLRLLALSSPMPTIKELYARIVDDVPPALSPLMPRLESIKLSFDTEKALKGIALPLLIMGLLKNSEYDHAYAYVKADG